MPSTGYQDQQEFRCSLGQHRKAKETKKEEDESLQQTPDERTTCRDHKFRQKN